MEALACTDYWGMYWGIEFYQAAKKAGIKPILWVELWYVPDRTRQDPNEIAGTVLLLARNYEGYEHLMHLISEAHLTWFHKIPRIDPECLLRYSTWLICITGGERSRLWKQLLNHHEAALLQDQRQQLTKTLWVENCYLSRVAQDIHQGTLAECNQMILQFAATHHVPCIVSGDVHYREAKDQHIFETALAIKDGKRIYDTDRRLAPRQMHLQTEDELRARLTQSSLSDDQINAMFQTTQDIADRIDLQIPMDKILFPIYESPEDITTIYKKQQQELIVS